jgi:hypothetical protein
LADITAIGIQTERDTLYSGMQGIKIPLPAGGGQDGNPPPLRGPVVSQGGRHALGPPGGQGMDKKKYVHAMP